MRARLDRIKAALSDPAEAALINATASDELSNQLITKLRTQYLDLAAREADWSEKYGRNHLQVTNLRDNMRGLRASIFDELQRLREAYKGDYEVATDAEKLIATQLRRAIADSQTSNEAQIVMNNLETSAETYRAMYDNFMKRYAEANEQQHFPYTEAKVITKATPPIVQKDLQQELADHRDDAIPRIGSWGWIGRTGRLFRPRIPDKQSNRSATRCSMYRFGSSERKAEDKIRDSGLVRYEPQPDPEQAWRCINCRRAAILQFRRGHSHDKAVRQLERGLHDQQGGGDNIRNSRRGQIDGSRRPGDEHRADRRARRLG